MSKIGRNDSCPCGSGKKYKHCCMLKQTANQTDLIKKAVLDHGYSDNLSDVLCNMYRYMKNKPWRGACHASCSVLFVALSELGYNPTLCIGEVRQNKSYFDHSWIELDGKIIDIAISLPLIEGVQLSDIILFDKDIVTGEKAPLNYGVKGMGLDFAAQKVINTPFVAYMDAFPENKNGLWDIVSEVLNHKIDIEIFRNKYKNVQRKFICRV